MRDAETTLAIIQDLDERYLKCHRLESRMIGNDPVRFGGGRRKRSLMATAPTAYPTRRDPKKPGRGPSIFLSRPTPSGRGHADLL